YLTTGGTTEALGLAIHLKLDETGGTDAYDHSGYGHYGTMMGGLSGASDSVPGQVDTALNFNGSSDYIETDISWSQIDRLFCHQGSDFTVAAWINPQSLDRMIWQAGGDSYSGSGFFYLEPDGTLRGGC